MTKICYKCKIEKSVKEFCKDKIKKDGLSGACRKCKAEYVYNNKEKLNRNRRKRYRTDPKYKNTQRNYQLKMKYGISIEIYKKLFKEQKGKCLICGESSNDRALSVDHKHDKTKKIRGLLCWQCNAGLGNFKDKIKLFKKAIEYLENH